MENPMVNYGKIIAETAKNHYNVRDEYKNNTVEENAFICHLHRRKFSVGCINVTGELNVGMMIRSACLMGAENFYIFGRKKFDKRSTVGAENYINIVQHTFDDPLRADEDIYQKVVDLYIDKHDIVLCEHGGSELGTFSWNDIGVYPQKKYTPLFLFGSESHGLPSCLGENLNFYKVSIPQRGVLRSYNVSSAMSIIVWDFVKEIHL